MIVNLFNLAYLAMVRFHMALCWLHHKDRAGDKICGKSLTACGKRRQRWVGLPFYQRNRCLFSRVVFAGVRDWMPQGSMSWRRANRLQQTRAWPKGYLKVVGVARSSSHCRKPSVIPNRWPTPKLPLLTIVFEVLRCPTDVFISFNLNFFSSPTVQLCKILRN